MSYFDGDRVPVPPHLHEEHKPQEHRPQPIENDKRSLSEPERPLPKAPATTGNFETQIRQAINESGFEYYQHKIRDQLAANFEALIEAEVQRRIALRSREDVFKEVRDATVNAVYRALEPYMNRAMDSFETDRRIALYEKYKDIIQALENREQYMQHVED